ncbi:MAG: glycosyltransferase family 2 protein [Luteolibacter sp.]
MSALPKIEEVPPLPVSGSVHTNPEISFVVPAHNEATSLPFLASRLLSLSRQLGFTCEIILVDDGSRDDTATVAAGFVGKIPLRLVRLSRNFGKEQAVTAGIDVALGNAIVIVDADLQHPVELVGEFIRLWKEGYEMVYGVRIDRNEESGLKRGASHLFYHLLGKMSSVFIPPDATDFRLLDRKVADALRALPENNRFMKGLFHWVGFRSISVPFHPLPRHAGKSSFNFTCLLQLGITGLTSFSQVPLRLAAAVGGLISIGALLYAAWIFCRTLYVGSDVPGWATLTVGVLFLGGVQLLFIGILGEYVGRIFEEVKGRLNYIVAEDSGPCGQMENSEPAVP